MQGQHGRDYQATCGFSDVDHIVEWSAAKVYEHQGHSEFLSCVKIRNQAQYEAATQG